MGIGFLLLFLPLISQLIVGSFSLIKSIRFKFQWISLIHLFLQILFSFIGMKIISSELDLQHIRCGQPLAAFFFACVFFLIVLVAIIVIQLIIKKLRKL